MLDSTGNLVSFGSLDRLLEELASLVVVAKPSPREVQVAPDDSEGLRDSMRQLCEGLSLPAILFQRCLLRCISEDVPLGSIASGIHFFLERLEDPNLRNTIVNDWVLATLPSDISKSLPILKSDAVRAVLTEDASADLFCFFRFRLALVVAGETGRDVSTADACYALISNLPESQKIAGMALTWEGLRRAGYPLWVTSPEELKRQCAALLRRSSAELGEAPEDPLTLRRLTEQTLFWAVAGGCSPRAVGAWKWRENQKFFELLTADWAAQTTRGAALRAAVAHKRRSEFLFAAAILIWLGDLPGACRDCLLRGLGDWQLALFVADLFPGEQQRSVYQELWDGYVLAPKDPWLGFALATRMHRFGWEPPVSAARTAGWTRGYSGQTEPLCRSRRAGSAQPRSGRHFRN